MIKSNPEVYIQPQYNSACGLDIHRDSVMLYYANVANNSMIQQQFGTYTRDLKQIAKLLFREKVEIVLMESTGVYWISLYHILTDCGIQVIVANPYHVKQLPKQKTDKKDAKWLCKLAINGMVRNSFIPDSKQHELREYCRLRSKLSGQITGTYNRVVKLLERSNIKIRSVASTIRIKSCQLMIEALMSGQTDPKQLADLSLGKLRSKIPELELALEGKLSQGTIQVMNMLKADLDYYTNKEQELSGKIEELINQNYKNSYELLIKVSGVGPTTAQIVLSEIGKDMSRFKSADCLTAWSGLAPGNNESANKRKPASSRKGNKYLKTAMVKIAWSAVRTKNSYWSCLYAELTKRMRPQKAIIAVARRMLKLIYKILTEEYEYKEGGVELYHELKTKRLDYMRRIMKAS